MPAWAVADKVTPPPVNDNPTSHSLSYGDLTIAFVLQRRAARKTNKLAIHVEPNGQVLVEAPPTATLEQVLQAVRKRARWISEHLQAVHARLAHVLPREYVSGETAIYLGRRYQLKVVTSKDLPAQVRLRGSRLEVHVRDRNVATVREQIDRWLRTRAREVFATRLAVVAASLPWVDALPPMRLQRMKVQWGSCSPAGRLTLNPMLVKAPRECVDYVVLHELCHLKHHNHGAGFYAALDRYMPEWRRIKARLDDMAELLLCV